MLLTSVEQLQGKLEQELAWRKKEVTGIRRRAKRGGPSDHYLYRAGLVLLCAHWEGYLRASLQSYLDHVFSQRLLVKELARPFIAVSFFGDVKRAALADYPGSEQHHLQLADRIMNGVEVECAAPAWKVKTDANPSSQVTERLLGSVGLDVRLGMDTAKWGTTRVFLDEQIVRDRHHVAHGSGFRIDKEQFFERSERLLDLLDRVTVIVLHAANARAYIRTK